MWGWHLNVQAYAVAGGYDDAFAVASKLVALIGPMATVRECSVAPYFKFHDQFGIRLRLEASNLDEAYRRLMPALAADWTLSDGPEEASAIWNADQNGPAAIPAMRWMHLNLFQLSDE